MRQYVAQRGPAAAGKSIRVSRPAASPAIVPPSAVAQERHPGLDLSRVPPHSPPPLRIQAKLTVGQSDDPLEHEADRIADQVMRMPEPQAKPDGGLETLSRGPPLLQPKSAGLSDSSGIEAPPIVHEVLNSPGRPLDPATRAFFEPRFGQDFSAIRVHASPEATRAAQSIGARAYTAGNRIAFDSDEYAPQSQTGRRLLAHELAHVRQNAGHIIFRQTLKGNGAKPVSDSTHVQDSDKVSQDDSTKVQKTLTLSRGVLQMTSEGDFTTGANSVKRPHFPYNVNIFHKLTDAEIKAIDDAKAKHDEAAKKNPKLGAYKSAVARFGDPDANGIFKQDPNGNFTMGKTVDRHDSKVYSDKPAESEQLGTTNGSGVTISFGIDLGNRYTSKDSLKKDFIKAGILDAKGAPVDGNKADKLLEAVGLKGLKAAQKAAELRADKVELTATQALKLLGTVLPDYDKSQGIKGYKHGDGTLEPAIEEMLTASRYWGLSASQRQAVYDAAKDKTGAEQFVAAAKAVEKQKNALSKSNAWMKRGYNIFQTYLEVLGEKAKAGYTIKMSDDIASAETLTSANDPTLEIVKEVSKRAGGGTGKDLQKQITGVPLPDDTPPKKSNEKIAKSVGAGGKNEPDDVTIVQRRLVALGFLSAADAAAELPTQQEPKPLDSRSVTINLASDALLPKTIAAIRAYQTLLFGTSGADGLVGAKGQTWTALRDADSAMVAKMKAAADTAKTAPVTPK